MKCERCRKTPPLPATGIAVLLDYCALCSKNLCDACMAQGCCGYTPARSGSDDDTVDGNDPA